MRKLENKVALVTGGNSGIGLATARLFREHGARVIVTARSPESYERARRELGSEFDVVQTDVSRPEELDRLFALIRSRYDGLDVVFANAGVADFRPTPQVDEAFFDAQFDTNVRGLYFTVQRALPLLRKGSSVILNASVMAAKGGAGASVYSASKAAVRSFARSWTAEISPAQARFNVLSPGPIDTPIYSRTGLPPERVKAQTDRLAAGVPAKRLGTSEEMARAALFLASEDSSYVCGAELLADGGLGSV